jgi:hypothetical protein
MQVSGQRFLEHGGIYVVVVNFSALPCVLDCGGGWSNLLRVALAVCDARRTVSTAALLDRHCCRSRRLLQPLLSL